MASLFIKAATRVLIPTCKLSFTNNIQRGLPALSMSVKCVSQMTQKCGTTSTNNTSSNAWKGSLVGRRQCFSTEVDRDLHEFLTKEIALEKKQLKETTMPKIMDFTVTTNGPEVCLTKQLDKEKIVVTFDINNSVAVESPLAMESEDVPPDTVSKPPFVVEITNANKRTLSVHCSFPPSEEFGDEDVTGEGGDKSQPGSQDGMYDQFEIDEVAIHDGEFTESTYSHHASVMDGNLYEYLMDMLDERGINSEFIDLMTQFSTTYEHNKYVTFLEQLQSFVDPK